MATVLLREALQLVQQLELNDSLSSSASSDLKICQQQCRVLRSALGHLGTFLRELEDVGVKNRGSAGSLVAGELITVLRRCSELINACEDDDWLITTLLCEERREHFRDVHSQLYECIELTSMFLFQASFDKSQISEAYSRWLENRRHMDGAASEDRRQLTKLSLSAEAEADSEDDQALRLLSYMIVEKASPWIDHSVLQFKQHLGHGGYGTVYEATFLGRPFAVKVFGLSEASFDRELAVLAANKHPNILAVAGYSRDDSEQPCLVMEKMDMDLRDFLSKTKPSLPTSILILLQIAKGMDWLHSRDVIHRDLKPQNVLISGKDELLTVKIADFGLSRTNFDTACSATPGLGTRFYMAPEVWSSKYYSKRSDVFGYAMICYQVLTGRNPYEKNDLEGSDLMLRICNGLRPRDDFLTNYPPELVELTKRCWSNDPNDRPNFSDICSQLKLIKMRVLTNIPNTSEVRSSLLNASAPSSTSCPLPSRTRPSMQMSQGRGRYSSPGTSNTVRRASLDPKEELFCLVSRGKMADAFSKALALNDPGAVWYLCSKLDPNLLVTFNESVVLQIAEQINDDISEDTLEKLEWLRKASELMVNVDRKAWASTRLESFLLQFCQNLHGCLAVTPKKSDLAERLYSELEDVNSWISDARKNMQNASYFGWKK